MKYKKALSGFLLVTILSASGLTVFADNEEDKDIIQIENIDLKDDDMADVDLMEEKQSFYGSYTGVVKEVRDYLDTEGSKIISLESEEYGPANIVVSKDTYILDQKEITAGSTITAYYKANEPMILIYPPQYKAKVIVVSNEEYHNVKVDKFDENLVSLDNSLKLNISEDTEIVLQDGASFDGDIENAQLIVIYGASTRSIPAQTNPEKVIVLFEEKLKYQSLTLEELKDVIGDIGKLDLMVNNKKIDAPSAYFNEDRIEMLPLRAIAEALDLEVKWDGETQSIKLGDDISLRIGEDRYDYTKRVPVRLGAVPELIEGTTYVPMAFFKEIVEMNNAYIFEGQIVINNDEKME